MAKTPALSVIPETGIAAVQSAAKKWRDAEKRARQSVYSLLQAIYGFGFNQLLID